MCTVKGCNRTAEKRGFCQMHYRRWQRHGDPLMVKKRANGSGCIYIDREGYFRVQFGRRSEKLHRLIMEAVLGRKLSPDEIVHHRDHNKWNNHPANLELTTRSKHITHHHKGISDSGLNTDTHRYCPRCNQVKSVEDFYPCKHNAGGRRPYCIPCCAERTRESKDQRNARRRELRTTRKAAQSHTRSA